MVSYSRRTLLKTSAAFAGASALGFPAIVRACVRHDVAFVSREGAKVVLEPLSRTQILRFVTSLLGR